MKLIKLGKLIEPVDIRNTEHHFSTKDVRGISVNKTLIKTKANMKNVDVSNYKVLKKGMFAYCLVTSRNGNKISIALNEDKDCIISSINPVFKIIDENVIIADYLMLYFLRPEFDRYSRFNSWGSARETFCWEDFCDTDIPVPDIEIQKKYISIYNSLKTNYQACSKNLEDILLICNYYLDECKNNYKKKEIGEFCSQICEINTNFQVEKMYGIGLNGFITPNQRRSKESLKKCNIFRKYQFVYAPSSIKNGVIEYNDSIEEAICTEEYIVFKINNEDELDPYYLLANLKRSEFGRYIDFLSIDSVRNRFYFENLSKIDIPIPPIEIQRKIGNLYKSYKLRKNISKTIKDINSVIGPILIKGSLEEANNECKS